MKYRKATYTDVEIETPSYYKERDGELFSINDDGTGISFIIHRKKGEIEGLVIWKMDRKDISYKLGRLGDKERISKDEFINRLEEIKELILQKLIV